MSVREVTMYKVVCSAAGCCNCGSTAVVVNDKPPTDGDWYCYRCGSDEGLLGTPETVVQS